MNEHYPPGTFELPDDGVEEQKYIFEIHGEIEIDAYSEENAKERFENHYRDYLGDGYLDGNIEID